MATNETANRIAKAQRLLSLIDDQWGSPITAAELEALPVHIGLIINAVDIENRARTGRTSTPFLSLATRDAMLAIARGRDANQTNVVNLFARLGAA